jgi:hypothetical protein
LAGADCLRYCAECCALTDVINQATAMINVTAYNVTYDGTAHTASGTATGAGGVVLPSSDLNLTGTTHTAAGTYANDGWTFTDPNGNYASTSGTITDVIRQATAMISVTAYNVRPKKGTQLFFEKP